MCRKFFFYVQQNDEIKIMHFNGKIPCNSLCAIEATTAATASAINKKPAE